MSINLHVYKFIADKARDKMYNATIKANYVFKMLLNTLSSNHEINFLIAKN